MRVVSYNINGLRPRVAQSGSLSVFLDSLNADIICLQETKISRQELTADIAIAEGYESFFSCNRIVKRQGYSGVATFCRVGQTPSSTSILLPLAADEGFTGLLHFSRREEVADCKGRVGCYEEVFKTELTSHELLRLDSEGRCLVTDHGSFVLFNIYAPMVEAGDDGRLEFKCHFFQALQRRWEALLNKGRRVIIVGDFNVTPYPIDHCNPGPDFYKNVSRKWLRSILHLEGGPFRDVFRFIHPERKETYTCWAQNTGAEEFNYGTRIDLIIAAGPCSDESSCSQEVDGWSHSFVECEVLYSDILSEFRRAKADSLPRWHGGRTLKLEGSDHVPVFVELKEQRDVELHEVPSLAARFMPELRGRQQNLVSLLKRQPSRNGITNSKPTSSRSSQENPSRKRLHSSLLDQSNTKRAKGKVVNQDVGCTQRQKQSNLRTFFKSATATAKGSVTMETKTTTVTALESISYQETVVERKAFAEEPTVEPAQVPSTTSENKIGPAQNGGGNMSAEDEGFIGRSIADAVDSGGTLHELSCTEPAETNIGTSSQTELSTSNPQGKADAVSEWKRIQGLMARAVPLCCGHNEPCVARVVKKPGPSMGRGFYVCARAQGPSSNPEARCDHFEWSSSSMKAKGKALPKDNFSTLASSEFTFSRIFPSVAFLLKSAYGFRLRDFPGPYPVHV
ncbi:hypothetical protein R1flu_022140 [Riccia fluitans]|uniref:DNA-(apurinic or apyrimidinic site) endonuclease 2 n=1 Tax=Riccia fluitans TaxID=41844 RepID=A0ABD1ZS09_9MARC